MSGADQGSADPGGLAGEVVLVPLASHQRNMAIGFAIGSLLLVPQRIAIWASLGVGHRPPGGTLVAQLVGVPIVVGLVALAVRKMRPAARERLLEALDPVPPSTPVTEPAAVRKLSRRSWTRVIVLWLVLGLVIPFMAASMVALAIYVAVGARTERGLDETDGRQLLCRPRWFIWKPLAWRTVPATS